MTPFVVIVSLAILMLAALVIDGGRQLNAKGRAVAYAQEATRAGAQAIDVGDPRLDLMPQVALAAATEYCRTAMAVDAQLRQLPGPVVHDQGPWRRLSGSGGVDDHQHQVDPAGHREPTRVDCDR
ncbi:Tad domain-containing protein [Aeromicrobium sp. UC242_57]|uniref:Tad domain-containing protein n=1 Tax=Aeromicrobium sp. UC242_57 TaxID=3374624 RepID=UPI0037A9CF68